MSYILDALRRAEAERERKRGVVPGLQSQHSSALPEDDPPPKSSRLGVAIGAGAVVALALVALLGWALLGDRTPTRTATAPSDVDGTARAAASPAVPAAPTSLEAIAAAPPVRPALAAPPVVAPSASMAMTAAPMRAEPPPPERAPNRTKGIDVAAAKPSRRTSGGEGNGNASPTVASARDAAADNAVPTSAGAAEGRIVKASELPESVRREIPALAIGGASYSSDAASRMVIINGQVFHEGDSIANGLVLQQIRLRTAVLAWKGYRYEVTY